MKNDGEQKIYTKNEIIANLNHFLEVQMTIANQKEKEYYQFENNRDEESNNAYNRCQRELNNQIKAYANTAQSLVRIYNSDLENVDEEDNEDKKSKELVD